MNTLAANILINVSNNDNIETVFTNINKTVFDGYRRYSFDETIPKLKELTFVFNDTKDEVMSRGSLELNELYTEFFMPGSCSTYTEHYTSNCSNQSLYCRQIVAAIAYFVEKVNFEMSTTYTYPITILYNSHVMHLSTLEDIVNFLKYEG